MKTNTEKDCEKPEHKEPPEWIEDMMAGFPENQGGEGRHKCPYCAYDAGIEEGIRREQRRIAELLGLDKK